MNKKKKNGKRERKEKVTKQHSHKFKSHTKPASMPTRARESSNAAKYAL